MIPDPELIAAIGTVLGAILIFVGGLIGVWVSSRHNRVINENQLKDLQIKMIDQLQEERNHTEQLLKDERVLRVTDIKAIDERFEKYKGEVRADKALTRQHVRNLEHHINAQLPPPPPAPPPGYKP